MKEYFHLIQRFIAKVWLNINLQLTVVGVTGSYGKTTASNAIAKVLSGKYSVNKTDDNLDTVFNLPITILKTKIWNEVLVLEYGVDHTSEMDKHLSLVKPKIAILTSITPVHADKKHFGSLENIIKEKKKLIGALPEDGLAIFNFDDEIVRKIGEEFKGKKVFYGLDKRADVWADEMEISPLETKFVLNDPGQARMTIVTGLLGYPAIYSCLAAWIVGEELKVPREKRMKKLSELKPLTGRFSIEPGPLGTLLVNDSKRANFASTMAGLKSFAQFTGRKVAVLGEMGEIGESEVEIHRKVGEEAAKSNLDLLVGVGPLTKYLVEEAKKNGMKSVYFAKDVQEAADFLKDKLEKGDLLYLKASLLRHLERVAILLNDGQVSCKEVICHNYSSCGTCSRLVQ